MRIFVDNGDFKFFLEDSKSEQLRIESIDHDWDRAKSIVVVITMDSNREGDDERETKIIRMSRKVITEVMGIRYYEQVIISVRYDDLSKYERQLWM